MELFIKDNNTQAALRELDEKVAKALEAIGMQAESYAKMKCPVDTGNLRNSITHAQEGDRTEIIGTNVEYAAYVELGTSRQRPQPYLKPAATEHSTEYTEIVRSILSSG